MREMATKGDKGHRDQKNRKDGRNLLIDFHRSTKQNADLASAHIQDEAACESQQQRKAIGKPLGRPQLPMIVLPIEPADQRLAPITDAL